MRLLLCSLLLFSLGLGFVDVDDHNSRFITRYNARQFQKIQQFLIDSGNYAYFSVNTNLYNGDPIIGDNIYQGIRDNLYAYYGNLTAIACIVSYTDSPEDLSTYNECTAYFVSGVHLKFACSIKTVGNTTSGTPDNRYWYMAFSDPPPPPCSNN